MTKPSSDLIKQLVTAGDSFGFEMRVGSILRTAATAEIQHSGTYRSYGINQPHRQFDFRFITHNVDKTIIAAIECKNFAEVSPLVICGSARSIAESYIDILKSDWFEISQHGRVKHEIAGLARSVNPCALYPVGEFVGKSTIRPEPCSKDKELVQGSGYKLTGDSDVYEKWNQAVVHSAFHLDNALYSCASASRPIWTAAIPIVVVPDGRLWTIQYDDNGKIIHGPTVVDQATLFVGVKNSVMGSFEQSVRISHILFYTTLGLRGFVRQCEDKAPELWDAVFPEAVIQRANAIRRLG
jgi:hypothetical protein